MKKIFQNQIVKTNSFISHTTTEVFFYFFEKKEGMIILHKEYQICVTFSCGKSEEENLDLIKRILISSHRMMNLKLKRFSTLILSLFVINFSIVASFARSEEVYTNSSTVAKSRMKRYLIFQPGSRILVRTCVFKVCGIRTLKVSHFSTTYSFEWT